MPRFPKGNINWKKSIGYSVDFVYRDYKGTLKILSVDSDKAKCKVECDNEILEISVASLRNGRLGDIYRGTFRCKIGDIVNDYGRNFEIISRFRKGPKGTKTYKCICLNCGAEIEKTEQLLLGKKHTGCTVCGKRSYKVVKGINDIATTNPAVAKLFKNKKDTFLYSEHSEKKVVFVCQFCNRESTHRINEITNRGLPCICGDGRSYPEKIMYALLENAQITFEYQKSFSFAEDKIYDFYCPSLNIIIETHGKQHYDIGFDNLGCTLEDNRINDVKKRELAIENGIVSYYEIDCRFSTLDFIKNSIIQSGILDELDVREKDIDWESCDAFAQKNICKEICIFFEDNKPISVSEIADKFGLGRVTVGKYLEKGNQYGWCNYNRFNNSKFGVHNAKSKPVELDGIVYASISLCARSEDIKPATMISWLNGSHPMPATYVQRGLKYVGQNNSNRAAK